MGRLMSAWLVGACLTGCMLPVAVSRECRARTSACLKDCPIPQERYTGTGAVLGVEADQRSECEKRCHALCVHEKPAQLKPPADMPR